MKNARLVAEKENPGEKSDQSILQSTSRPHTGTSRPIETSVSAEEYRHLTDKYTELSKKYQDLSQKIKYLERKNAAVMQKNRDMKESVRAWQEYADRQAGRQKSKNEVKAANGQPRLSMFPHMEPLRPDLPSSPVTAITTRSPLSHTESGHSSPLSLSLYDNPDADKGSKVQTPHARENSDDPTTTILSESITPKPAALNHEQEQRVLNDARDRGLLRGIHSAEPALRHIDTHLQQTIPSSSQTTEDEGVEHVAKHSLAIDDEDDMPQFVSERSLKRKRDQPSRIRIYTDRSSDGTPVKPFHVKEEQFSSPPNIHNLNRKDTIDLDDPTSFILQTPRHPRHKRSTHSALSGTCRHQRSNSAPSTQLSGEQSAYMSAAVPPSNLPKVSNDLNATPLEMRALSEPSESAEIGDVLLPIDPNILPNVSDEQPMKRAKRSETRQQKEHCILAESGEELPPIGEHALRLTPGSARAKLNRKLHAAVSLQPSAAELSTTVTPSDPKIKHEPLNANLSTIKGILHIPSTRHERRLASFEDRSGPHSGSPSVDRPRWTMKVSEARSSSSRSPAVPPKRQSRLRQKPVAELTIQDFKPNPAYNQGYSYAFSETVRKRGDRMCLPGCTNPQCCGSTFRILAEAQAPLTASQEETLLEDYLGEAYDNFSLTQMSPDERAELILQARTKKLAKETGKHRQAYDGRRTPPGFWRVDFPTTQEQHEDRERAKEQAKNLVQERWLEANRKGGKWVFRDE